MSDTDRRAWLSQTSKSLDLVCFRTRCNDSTFHLSRRPLAKTFGVALREGGTNYDSKARRLDTTPIAFPTF